MHFYSFRNRYFLGGSFIAAALFTQGILCADPATEVSSPATQPTTAPAGSSEAASTTQPVQSQVNALIVQLGDPDPHVRNHASRSLEQIGAPALQALRAAANSSNLEVQMRARQLAANIERPPVPDPPGPVTTPNGVARVQSIRMSTINGSRIIDVNDAGRIIHIEENADGIAMAVSGQLAGKPVTQHYKARNGEELKQQNKDAFALYDQWSGQLHQVIAPGGNIVMRFQAGPVAIGPNPPPPLAVPPIPGRLGVLLAPQTPADGGVSVMTVLPNTRAAALGLQAQDVILKINDQPIGSGEEVRTEMLKHPAGLILEVRRDGKTITLKE